jgi:hypothetical protein
MHVKLGVVFSIHLLLFAKETPLVFYKSFYSISNNGVSGSFEALRDKLAKGSELKVGLGDRNYEEVIPFNSYGYSDEIIFGVAPYHRSSETLETFSEGFYETNLINFVYFVDKRLAIFRRDEHGTLTSFECNFSDYRYYNWMCDTASWKLCFVSPNCYLDEEKRFELTEMMKNGRDIKVKVEVDGFNYMLTPSILYFNKDYTRKFDISVKSHPVAVVDKQKLCDGKISFRWCEFLINLDGRVSILERMKSPADNQFWVERLLNFWNKALNKVQLPLGKLIPIRLSVNKNIRYQNEKRTVEWYVR